MNVCSKSHGKSFSGYQGICATLFFVFFLGKRKFSVTGKRHKISKDIIIHPVEMSDCETCNNPCYRYFTGFELNIMLLV